MKKIILSTLLSSFAVATLLHAQCNAGESEIQVVISPDAYPSEISWELRDYASQVLIGSGGVTGATFCQASSQCLEFKVFDSFGDGIFLPGFCKLLLNGIEVFNTNGQEYFQMGIVVNCAPGTACTSPETVVEGLQIAPGPDRWYAFSAPINGNYTITTCGFANTCDTKLYVYDACPPSVVDGPLGVIAYNDDFCGPQSEVTIPLQANHPVIIRVGDGGNACSGQIIQWSVLYSGPISGCMDPLACNFNPLAEIPDNSQCEYPPPGQSCDGPDLVPGYETLINSLFVDNYHQAQPCEIAEGCILGTGQRQLLKYGVTIWNLGNQPYYPGDPFNNPDAHEWDQCHGHYHYLGFAESYLYDNNNTQIDFARKTSYAIINTDCLPGVIPNGPALAPGCGDTYPAGYECQWVDITDVAPGHYILVLRVNGPELPDYLGRVEKTFDNNATYACIYIGQQANGDKYVELESGCTPFVDCMGEPLGNAQQDCAGECNGVRLRGDIDLDTTHTLSDVDAYVTQIMAGNLDPVTCNQLTMDTTFTVLDVARLNSCVRFNEGEHNHFGGNNGNHFHCNFPFHIENQQESIELGLRNHHPDDRYFDIYASNNLSYMLGFELQLAGVQVDSVVNLVSNFNPMVAYTADGHVMMLALDEFPLNKYFNESLLRVYYSELASSSICISNILDALNADAERIGHEIGDCLTVSSAAEVQQNVSLSLVPNPAAASLKVTIGGDSLGDATVQVASLSGQVVFSTQLQENRNYFQVNVADFAEGIYFLTVENEHFVKTEKFIVKR